MTASSPASASTPIQSTDNHHQGKQSLAKQHNPTTSSIQAQSSNCNQASCPSFNSSAAFQQIKQTQASLARLCRVHHNHHQQQQQQQSQYHGQQGSNGGASASSQSNQSSQQQQLAKLSLDTGQQQPQKPTTFVDCLIRRFKNCFDEDFCTVPMFVVGNLSPGSDGTNLILPPCVSLGGQNINRFSSPKNLRIINSIRDSCRSIEELDLGGNKLTDLIEVYKILQCTPNLRFLNLSENDLSRTSPVAMASYSYQSTTTTHTSTTTLAGVSSGGMVGSGGGFVSSNGQQQSSSPGASAFNQRTYLAPINQNNQLQTTGSIGTRRHSTLGQTHSSLSPTPSASTTRPSSASPQSTTPSVHLRARQTISRVAEARRLSAANALAQSNKTSSSVASKLANSAVASGSLSRQALGSSRTIVARSEDASASMGVGKQTKILASQRLQATHKSTLHLARSLSSLSAKDIRAASGTSIGRLSAQRSSSRNESSPRALPGGANNRRSSIGSVAASGRGVALCDQQKQQQQFAPSASQMKEVGAPEIRSKITTSTSHQKLYAEPIVENEDVDMSAEQQQLSPSGQATTQGACDQVDTTSNSHINHQQQQQQQQQQQLKTFQMGNPLRSYCNTSTNSSLLTIGNNNNGGNQNNQSTNFRRTFESVKALALNNTGCPWKVVCSILSRMPNLEELHLSLNNYEKIDLDTNEFKHHSLKRLYLCNNPKLTNWEELDKLLIAFPSLEALSIADCNISQIPDNLDRAREWRKLCGLNINGWPIKEWPVVERLNQLPSLIDLRCRNLDVLNTIDEPRHHLIARLPKLQRLNGSEIEEREDAEKAFLRFFMVNSHLERPSRFHELMKIYGEVPHIDVDVDLSPPSQARVRIIYLNRNHYRKADEDDLLMSEDFLLKLMDNINANEIKALRTNNATTESNDDAGNGQSQENMDVAEVTAPSSSSSSQPLTSAASKNTPTETQLDNSNRAIRLFKDEGQEVVALDVDLRQSVRKFKSTIASLFGLDSQNLIIYYIDHEMVGLMGPELIKHNQKKLWNYNVQDGDQFIVEDR